MGKRSTDLSGEGVAATAQGGFVPHLTSSFMVPRMAKSPKLPFTHRAAKEEKEPRLLVSGSAADGSSLKRRKDFRSCLTQGV